MIRVHDWKAFGVNLLVSEPSKGYYHFRRYRCRTCGAILVDQMGSGPIVPTSLQGYWRVILEGPDRENIAAEHHRASRGIACRAQALADAMAPSATMRFPDLSTLRECPPEGSCPGPKPVS